MPAYVNSNEQLIVELYVRDLKSSAAFYQRFGFTVERDDGNFIVLKWEDSMLFLEAVPDCPPLTHAIGNIRIMVAEVDQYWALAVELGAEIIRPIKDRYYGLRDFTIAGPDGLGLRFATRLSEG
jgi:predicted lactoylglutathione lyase